MSRCARPSRPSPGNPGQAEPVHPAVRRHQSVNRELEAKARALAGIKGYVTNLRACPDGTPVTAEFVIGSYHQLFQIEKSFRMSKHDLQARPIYHRKRDSDRSPPDHRLRRPRRQPLDRAARPAGPSANSSRPPAATATIQIQAGNHTITAADPPTRRPPQRPRRDQRNQLGCALI